MLVTLAGIVTRFSAVQFSKAPGPMDVSVSGSVIPVICPQFWKAAVALENFPVRLVGGLRDFAIGAKRAVRRGGRILVIAVRYGEQAKGVSRVHGA